MFSHLVRTVVVAVCGVSIVAGAVACSSGSSRKSKAKPDSGDLFEDDQAYEDDDPMPSTPVTLSKADAGSIDVPTRPNDGGAHDGRAPDVGDDGGLCPGDIQPGDLRIVEVMIAAKSGQGDPGEWVEIQSSKACRINVRGLTIQSPRGTGNDSVTINQDLFVAPYGTFVVADDTDPAKNGNIPGDVVAWGQTDVLKNDGDSVEILAAGVSIDKVVYPALSVSPGVSFAFPWDCAWADRVNWQRWSKSVDSFGTAGALKGTPNRDNTDVSCY